MEGRGDLVSLIARIGQAPFEDCFLNDNDLSDEERAARCGVSCADAVRLRDLVDRLYVRSEIAGAPAAAPAVPTYSPVAGIEIEDGKAVIAFFNREIWKGRYRVDDQRRDGFLGSMDRKDAMAAARLLGELEHIERRKATLYRLLEILVEAQARYLISGKPEDRKALTQRTVSEKLDTIPSVLNRLISNKSVQLPWGLEAPLKVFMPSRKLLARDNLHDIVVTRPGLSDEALGREMKRVYGWRLSRRSITQYRHELGLAAAYGR